MLKRIGSEISGQWRIELLGGLRLFPPGGVDAAQPITHFRTRKISLLLAFLALNPLREHGREELVERFWPELPLDTGRNNLSYTLTALRRQCEAVLPSGAPEALPLLVIGRHAVRLNIPAAVAETDVAQFENLLRLSATSPQGQSRSHFLKEAITLYRGPLLPGVYEDWAVHEQERLTARYTAALVELAQLYAEEGAWAEARDIAARVLAIDPEWDDALLVQQKADTALAAESKVVFVRGISQKGELLPTAPDSVSEEPLGVRAETVSERRSNLPLTLTRLFGREADIERLNTLWVQEGGSRLVTITGPGGMGKTRLALAAAARAEAVQYLRPFWGPLADLTEPGQVLLALASRLGKTISDRPEELLETLVRALEGHGDKVPPLLILDNAEHLLAAQDTPETLNTWIQDLLTRLPALRILVTSRRILGIDGEQEFPLSPLLLPERGESSPATAPAVSLFLDRARTARPDYALSPRNAAAIGEICHMMDGLPLALEMVAAWVRTFSAVQIRDRLRQQYRELLISRRRDAPVRHSSVEATLEWSFRLLTPSEQAFLLRLSVFRGGWETDAAEVVCGEGLPENASGLLRSLQEHSLVTWVSSPTSSEDMEEKSRFRLLEVVRAFAAERLEQVGEAEAISAKHGAYFATLAAACAKHSDGPDRDVYLRRLDTERENLRAALEWYERHGRADKYTQLHLQLCADSSTYFYVRNLFVEGYAHLTAALDRPEVTGDAVVRAWVQVRAAHLASYLGYGEAAEALLVQADRVARSQGDDALLGHVLYMQGGLLSYQGRLDESHEISVECLAVFRQAGNEPGIAMALASLGDTYLDFQDYLKAVPCAEEALMLYRRQGRVDRIGFCLALLGQAYLGCGQTEPARTALSEAIVLLRRCDNIFVLATSALPNLARIAREDGDYPAATNLYREALTLIRESDHELAIELQLRGLAQVASAAGNHEAAICLTGAIEAMRQRSAFPHAPFDPTECDCLYTTGVAAVGLTVATLLRGEGRALATAEAVAYALNY